MWDELSETIYTAITSLTAVLFEGVAPHLQVPLKDSLDALHWLREGVADNPGSLRAALAAIRSICEDLDFDTNSAYSGGYPYLGDSLFDIANALRDVL